MSEAIRTYRSLNYRIALVINARDELRQLRSYIVSELGSNPRDSYLKALFVSTLDEADALLRKAVL